MDPTVRAVLSFLLLYVVWTQFGLLAMISLGYAGQAAGLLCFFPLLYSLYTSQWFGYNVARNIMHPRQARPHSTTTVHTSVPGVNVLPVPVLADNYAYIVWWEDTKRGVVIDPADPRVVHEAAKELGVELTHVIATHKHWDHSGGNIELQELYSGRLEVVGSKEDSPVGVTLIVGEGDFLEVDGLQFKFYSVPGHTKGHLLTTCNDAMCFSGDSLFCCGTGAFFECDSPSELLKTYDRYHTLPDTMLLWPGHEYSEMLASQAHRCNPADHDIKHRYAHFRERRLAKDATVPSTIGIEKKVNMFLKMRRAALSEVATVTEVQNMMFLGERYTRGTM